MADASADPAISGQAPAGRDRSRPTVFLHIGEPKTGTTFLQQVMWRNRPALAAQGVVLPGHHPQDHFRASQDLREIQKLPSDPAGAWTGEWDILASQAKQAPRVAVISHELFSAADADQAARAVRSLEPAEVHLVLTVRDMASLLPAEWQETVKHRNSRPWPDWLSDVIDIESVSPDRRQWWFWRVHDTLAILDLWSAHISPERTHVITMPPRGSAPGLLWERFAGLLGVDPASVDVTRARANSSLGLPEIEFLRRLNCDLPDELPDWFYMWSVKEGLAHKALAARPVGERLTLPAERIGWAKDHGELLTAGLRASAYDVVGDLGDLLPSDGGEPGTGSAGQPAEPVLDVAVAATAAMVLGQFRRAYPAVRPQPGGKAGIGGLAARVESTMAASPRIKRTVRELSSRHSSVRRLRILAWRALEQSRTRRHP
jgi:hypothetical protein